MADNKNPDLYDLVRGFQAHVRDGADFSNSPRVLNEEKQKLTELGISRGEGSRPGPDVELALKIARDQLSALGPGARGASYSIEAGPIARALDDIILALSGNE